MKPELLAEAPPVIKKFLGYLETIKGKSPKTVEEYYLDLRTFFRYIKQSNGIVPSSTPLDEISIADVDLDLIKAVTLTKVFEYMNYVGSERHNMSSTRSRKVSSLRTFYSYLTNKTHQLESNPIEELETPKHKKTLPKFLTLEQSLELLNSVDGSTKERDYCMLVLFLNCGMRLSELVSLNLNDVRHGSSTVKITGKGNKERIIYLNDACVDAIDQYLKVRPADGLIDKEALFISSQKKRISPKTVQFIVKKYLAKIELGGPGYSVHKLRHTAATLMYQHGHVDIRVLKDILGHESLATTQIYTHLSSEQMENASRANPLANVKPKTSAPKINKEKIDKLKKEPE
ncbi:MAG TPA: tyrosine recombinase XerC [Oscillospiraceae bacterium]|nr:tyrosine recombinase XerC [Oscillospiraceae bacterium]